MTSTGITVDPETSMIYASYKWWEACEWVIMFLIVLSIIRL